MGSGLGRMVMSGMVAVAVMTATLTSQREALARDEFMDRVNKPLAAIPKDKRSDLVILPALAKMEAPPAEVRTLDRATLMLPSHSGWDAAEAWAKGAPQVAVLKAMVDVTSEEDYHIAMVFAQQYGIEAVADSPELIEAKLYSELGDPPTLSAVKIGYLEKMSQLQILANVEATRRSASGDLVGALDLMFHLLYFERQLADRPMLKEKRMGMEGIRTTLERIRDLVYQDMKAEKHQLDYKDVEKYVDRLDEEKGYLGLNRIRMPMGTFVGAEQLLSRILVPKGGVNDETFASTMARLNADDRPLRLFSESAYWEAVRSQHEGAYASHDMLVGKDEQGGIVADFNKRWSLDPFDSYVKSASDYKKYAMSGPKYASIRAALAGIEDLFPLRVECRTEVVGTRMALALYGYWREHNATFPNDITSIRPKYVAAVDKDPYEPSRKIVRYFVPIRDNIPRQIARQDPIPLSVHAYPPKPYKNFVIPLREDTFVLYSIGPDGQDGYMKDATQADPEAEGDYMLWPPMVSLIRKSMMDAGELK